MSFIQLKKILGFLILFVIGGLIGYFLARYFIAGKTSYTPLSYKISLLPFFILVIFLMIALHEAGHLIGGFISRFKFQMYVVGPFLLLKESDKLKLKWNTNLNHFGGLALCLPIDTVNLRNRFLVFIAGGPLSNLIYAAIALSIFYGYGFSDSQANIFTFLGVNFWMMSGYVSLGLFAVSAIPAKGGGFYSDGARIMNLLKEGEQSKLDTAILFTVAQSSSGIRPRNLNINLLEECIALPLESNFKVYFHSYLYYAYLDRGNVETAEKHLNLYYEEKDKIPQAYRAMVHLEMVYFKALHEGNASEARNYFEKAKINNLIPKHLVLRAETALYWVEGNFEKAKESARKALIELPKSMDKGTAIAEKDWLESLIKKIEEKQMQA